MFWGFWGNDSFLVSICLKMCMNFGINRRCAWLIVSCRRMGIFSFCIAGLNPGNCLYHLGWCSWFDCYLDGSLGFSSAPLLGTYFCLLVRQEPEIIEFSSVLLLLIFPQRSTRSPLPTHWEAFWTHGLSQVAYLEDLLFSKRRLFICLGSLFPW